MKRKLSLLLAVVMILGTFSFAFADEGVDVPAFLEKEGILKGNTKGDLMLDEPLSRKDAVVLLARLLKAEDEAEAFEKEGLPTFNDLAGNPYYNAFLGWAEDNGYFTGKPDGSFGYNDNLEAVEYSLVLLRALGYVNEDKAAEWDEAWDTAKKLGLLEDVKAERREEILRKEVAQMTFNALGVKMKDSDKTLAEFLGITMPEPAKLTAEVKDTENLKEVVVKLSNAKLANKDKLENTANYRIKGNTIERVEVKDNDVLVQVKDTFRSGKQYELEIKGVDKAIDGKYKFVAKDNTIPSVEKVEVLGEYGIKVVASEPIEDVRGRNFLVDGKYIVMNVETYGRNLVLTPYNGSFPSGAKTLTIEGLKDFAGYKSAKEDFDIEIVKDNEAPKVEDVILKGNKVEVVFDKDIYKDSVDAYYSRSDVGNISYELGRHTIYANKATKVDTNKVVYEFKDDEAPSRRDSVTIVDVANHSKVKMEKTTMAVREVLDDIEPEIISKKIVSKDVKAGTAKIELRFDKDVTGDLKKGSDNEFNVNSHFALYENEVSKRNELDNKVVSAKYDYDDKEKEDIKDVIVVELKGLEEYDRKDNDVEYVLEIEGFADASSSRNKMYRDYYEFKFEKSTGFFIKDIKVVTKDERDTVIEIEFNKALDRDIAEDATNYVFYTEKDGKKTLKDDVADLDGEAILRSNGRVVVLEIPVGFDDLKDDYKGLKVLDAIKDTKGNRVADYNTIFNIRTEKIENPLQSDVDIANFKEDHKEALALKVDTVKVDDKAKVNAALAAYDNLSDEAKDGLKDEKDLLDKLLAAIEILEEEAEPLGIKSAKETRKAVKEEPATPAEYSFPTTTAVGDVLVVDGVEIEITDATFANNLTLEIRTALGNKGIETDFTGNKFVRETGENFDWKYIPETGSETTGTTNGKTAVEGNFQEVAITLNKDLSNLIKVGDTGTVGSNDIEVIGVNGRVITVKVTEGDDLEDPTVLDELTTSLSIGAVSITITTAIPVDGATTL